MYPFDPSSLKDMPLDQLYSVLSGDAWKKLQGAARDLDIDLAAFKKAERDLEDSRY